MSDAAYSSSGFAARAFRRFGRERRSLGGSGVESIRRKASSTDIGWSVKPRGRLRFAVFGMVSASLADRGNAESPGVATGALELLAASHQRYTDGRVLGLSRVPARRMWSRGRGRAASSAAPCHYTGFAAPVTCFKSSRLLMPCSFRSALLGGRRGDERLVGLVDWRRGVDRGGAGALHSVPRDFRFFSPPPLRVPSAAGNSERHSVRSGVTPASVGGIRARAT